jgi:hypothetical protein
MASWREKQTMSNYDVCRIIDFDDDGSEGHSFELEEIERKPLPEPLVPDPSIQPSADDLRDAWLFEDLKMKEVVEAPSPVVSQAPAPFPEIAPTLLPAPPRPPSAMTGLGAMMADVPMSVWKRLAVYPLVGFFIFDVLFPCRGSLRLDLLFALAAIVGATGAFLRMRAEQAWR